MYKSVIVKLMLAGVCVGALLPASAMARDPAGIQVRRYYIAQTYPYPPWDVGRYEGVSTDVTLAICEANRPMECRFAAMPSELCFDTDAGGHAVVGAALASGAFDGCLTWFRTAAREQLGAEFANGYSRGSIPQLIAADGNDLYDGLGGDGDLGGAAVAFFAGFFSDADCLGDHYTGFGAQTSGSGDAERAALVDSLQHGDIDLIFWDNVSTVPAGTHLVGAPIQTCGPDELGLAVYPPSLFRKDKSDQLRRDWNFGLALIRENGVLADICSHSTYPGGDPECILDGPPPTVQCLQDNAP